MHLYGNVVDWDDSAGQEAFHDAKKRYWAEINGLPCDISLPKPDIYIDDIDWNPDIDPALISDLDRAYVAPDVDQKRGKVGDTNQQAHRSGFAISSVVGDANRNNCDNPWACNYLQDSGALKDKTWGWDQWDTCVNDSKNLDSGDNPWERNCCQSNEAVNNNTWGDCGDKSWGWNQGENHINNQSMNSDKVDDTWEHGYQGVNSVKGRGWEDCRDGSRGWNHWENCVNESKNLDIGDNSWGRSFNEENGAPKDRGWRDYGDNTWDGKGWNNNNNNELKNLESSRGSGGWGNGGRRKREGSHQYIPRYKSSRFQGDEPQRGGGHQKGNHWRNGRDNKRVSFAFD